MIYLVACSKSKLASPAAARDLYTGQLFRLCRTLVESQQADWLILSAFYDVIEPSITIRPYNRFLGDYNQRERTAWGDRVRMKLAARLATEDRVVFLAPRNYVDSIVGNEHQRTTVYWKRLVAWLDRVETPLAGLGIGQQKAWVKAQLSGVNPQLSGVA